MSDFPKHNRPRNLRNGKPILGPAPEPVRNPLRGRTGSSSGMGTPQSSHDMSPIVPTTESTSPTDSQPPVSPSSVSPQQARKDGSLNQSGALKVCVRPMHRGRKDFAPTIICIRCSGKMVFLRDEATAVRVVRQAKEEGTVRALEKCAECNETCTFEGSNRVDVTADYRHYICLNCTTKLCKECYLSGRHEPEYSCYDPATQKYSTELYDCFGTEEHRNDALKAWVCYYGLMENSAVNGKDIRWLPHNLSEVEPTGWESFCKCLERSCTFPCSLYSTLLCGSVDLVCPMSTILIRGMEEQLAIKYGLEQHDFCPTVFFCRWCVFARMRRELIIREEPQADCCGNPMATHVQQSRRPLPAKPFNQSPTPTSMSNSAIEPLLPPMVASMVGSDEAEGSTRRPSDDKSVSTTAVRSPNQPDGTARSNSPPPPPLMSEVTAEPTPEAPNLGDAIFDNLDSFHVDDSASEFTTA